MENRKVNTPKVSDLMSTKLITVQASYSLEAAQALMEKNSIRHLPVTDDHGEILGIISDRDLQRAIHSKILGGKSHKYESLNFDPNAKVHDYMTSPIKTISSKETLKVAVQRMVNEKVSSLLVQGETQVEGILTTQDCLQFLSEVLAH